MKLNRSLKAVAVTGLCALGLAVTMAGCEPSKSSDRLTVGKVDTAELLHDDPDYQNLSIQYMKENTDLRAKFVDRMKGAGEDPTARDSVQKEYVQAQGAMDKKWMEKTQTYLESRHSSIRDMAQEVAEKKDIDIVIIDSPQAYPTTEWGGVDITKDLALAMSQGGGKPASTASPAKKGS